MVRKFSAMLVLLALAGAASFVVARPGFVTGPYPSLTGAPEVAGVQGESNCTECHYVTDQNNLNAGNGHVRLLDLPTTYVPGQTYTIRVEVDCDSTRDAALRHWGFQLTAYKSSDGLGAGTFIVPSGNPGTDPMQILTGFMGDPWETRTYVEHTQAGIQEGANGPVTWSLQWQAPLTASGTILFAAAGNAANGDLDTGGDWIFTTVDSVVDLSTPTRPISWGGIKAQYRR